MTFAVAMQAQNDNANSSGEWTAPKSADAKKNSMTYNVESVAAGQKLYSMLCVVCHGDKGKGDGISASALATKPSNLISSKVQRQSDGALFWKLSEGNPPMLSFKSALSEEQIWQIVNYVRSLDNSKAHSTAKATRTDKTKTEVGTTNPTHSKKVEKSVTTNAKPVKEGKKKSQ